MRITTDKNTIEPTIYSAVSKYKDFIASTYGPAGKKTLIIQNEFSHEAVDDGKRSANSFEIEDELQNAVVQYIKETTQKGKDGTTTAGIIMSNIVLNAYSDYEDILSSKDYHGKALLLKKGLSEAVKKVRSLSKKIKTKEELKEIAHNSFNDEKIAELISETIFKIGKDGVLSIEDSKTADTTVEIVNGIEIQKGYYSPYFVNSEDKVVLQNPGILIVNKKINLFREFAAILELAVRAGTKDFVVIADGFGDDVVRWCIGHAMKGTFRPLLVEVPGLNDKQENFADIAAVTGATLVDDKVLKLSDVKLEHLGTCETIKSTKDKTTILEGNGKTKDYIAKLKSELEKADGNFQKDRLTMRIASLSGGVALIKVGAYTENEQKSKKTKVENAVNSTQIAFRGGVVPGAGKALMGIKTCSGLLNNALEAPRKQLEENGAQYLDENTVDPTDVVVTAIETAVSIAEGLLTIGNISVPKRKKEEEPRF